MANFGKLFERIHVFSDGEIDWISKAVVPRIEGATQRRCNSLAAYHDTHGGHHHLLAPKRARQFPEVVVEEFFALPGLMALRSRLGEFDVDSVIDERGRGVSPEVYFRLVRPGCPSDVGMPHCDHWFHSKAGLPHEIGSTLKLWVSVCSEPGLNGLHFYPDASFESLHQVFIRGPQGESSYSHLLGQPLLPSVRAGEGFIFQDDVIHGGALNRGDKTRCSVEITFVRRK